MDGGQDGGRWERSNLNEYLEQERVQREAEHRQAEFDDQQLVYRGRPGEFFCSSVHHQRLPSLYQPDRDALSADDVPCSVCQAPLISPKTSLSATKAR